MQPSPLNFRELKFVKVLVEADLDFNVEAGKFDFEGASIGWTVSHGKKEDNSHWWVACRFFIDNSETTVRCPYLLDLQAVGIFTVSEDLKVEKHEKLVYENGSALVYGAMREMVSMITSRSVLGPLMLPTPSFVGTHAKYLSKKTTPPASNS
jgi:preprotein translocase subunit SecB